MVLWGLFLLQFSVWGDFDVFVFCLVFYIVVIMFMLVFVFGFCDVINVLGLVYMFFFQGISLSFYWVGMVGVSVVGVDVGIFIVLFVSMDGVFFDLGILLIYFVLEIYDLLYQSIVGVILYFVVFDFVDVVVVKFFNRLCFDLVGVQSFVLFIMVYYFIDVDVVGVIVDFDLGLENIYMNDMNIVWCLVIVWGESGNFSIVGNI